MKKRKVGIIEVSEVGMGCMGFSHGYGQVPEESYSIDAIRKAHDYGCTFFDTAETYGAEQFYEGHNEQLVGNAVEPFRKDVVLATKFHLHEADYAEDVSLYDSIRRHLENSMENLKTDYIDLYYLHRLNEAVSVEEIAIVMGRFIKKGLIRGWGLSQVSVETIDKAHQIAPLSAIQNLYSMVERDCEKEVFPYCIEHDIGVVPFSPIASGFLSGKLKPDTVFGDKDDVRKWVPQLSKENIVANQPILDIITKFSNQKDATNSQISLAWMLHKYPNVVPIPGSKNQERILENLGGSNVKFTDGEFVALEEALNACDIHGHRGIVETEQNTFSNNWKKE